ncbi:hypothetical protein T12_7144 [Trichinella patagoniensis]|uniref:Uncharacterized protein n=1 Tax=Trichinella patagoniensis TaxID=990121 RepID=A0A0V0ZAM2_9BILA|nr:hypothetical protein T12_7144 [Trichinella patagoniensis]
MIKVMVSAENEISSSNFEKRFNALIAYMKSIHLVGAVQHADSILVTSNGNFQVFQLFPANECHSIMLPLLSSVKTSKSTCCQMQKIHPSVM